MHHRQRLLPAVQIVFAASASSYSSFLSLPSIFFASSPARRQLISSSGRLHLSKVMSSSTTAAAASASPSLQYIDAGANLLDLMYQGTYNGKERHEPDLDIVLARAYDSGVHHILTLAGTPKESEELLQLIEKLDQDHKNDVERVKVFGTVGVHPTRCAEIFAEPCSSSENGWRLKSEQEQSQIIDQLKRVINQGKTSGNIVAVGEFGLDYARLQFSPKEIQKIGCRKQLEMAIETKLPLYLHNRDSGDDLYDVLLEYRDRLVISQGGDGNIRGIVHSFDEGIDIANKLMSLGLHIGINGCSLKTAENLQVVAQIPLDNIILETDCPWCDIRPTHASFEHLRTTFRTKKEKQYNRVLAKDFCVKNRTEPCHVAQVAEVVAGVKSLDVAEVVLASNRNVFCVFGDLEKIIV